MFSFPVTINIVVCKTMYEVYAFSDVDSLCSIPCNRRNRTYEILTGDIAGIVDFNNNGIGGVPTANFTGAVTNETCWERSGPFYSFR